MGPPPAAPAATTYGCGGGVATVPCAGGAVAVGPIPAQQVPAGVACPSSGPTGKPQMTSNGYIAVTPRPPSLSATLVPQVSDETNFAFYTLLTGYYESP